MKRDMDLVRRILVETEAAEGPYDPSFLLSDDHPTVDNIAYHVELMQAHGLIDANVQRHMGGQVAHMRVIALTWDGCDYLDAIRNDRVWAKTKKAVVEAVGSTTVSLFKETALLVGKQMITANLGM